MITEEIRIDSQTVIPDERVKLYYICEFKKLK